MRTQVTLGSDSLWGGGKRKGLCRKGFISTLIFYLLIKIKVYVKNSCSKCKKMVTGANSNRKILWFYHKHNHVTELHSKVPRASWWGYVRMKDEVGKVLEKWEAKGFSGETASLLSVGTDEVSMGKGWHYPSDTGWVYGTGSNWRLSKQPGNSKVSNRAPQNESLRDTGGSAQESVPAKIRDSENLRQAAGAVPRTSQAHWKDASAGQYTLGTAFTRVSRISLEFLNKLRPMTSCF